MVKMLVVSFNLFGGGGTTSSAVGADLDQWPITKYGNRLEFTY